MLASVADSRYAKVDQPKRRPFSRLNLSRSGRRPFTLFSRSPFSRSEYTELMAEDGSDEPSGCRSPIAKFIVEYEGFEDAGPLV